MSIFDQRGQHVNYQYNAAGNINFGHVQNQMGLTEELEKLQTEVAKAKEANIINEDLATDVNYRITKAVQQAKKDQPDKKAIIDNINIAKTLIEGISALGGLVGGLTKAAELAQKFF